MTDQTGTNPAGDQKPLVAEPPKVVVPARPSKPRGRKPKVVAREPLRLPSVTLLNGTKDSTLLTTISKKYQSIEFLTPDGKKTHALVHTLEAGKKADNLGSAMLGYTLALINAALAGQGQGPDASACYVTDNWPKVVAHWGKGFEAYRIKAVPAGRSGAAIYEGTIADFLTLCRAKANIVRASAKKYGVARPLVVKSKTHEEAPPSITF